MEDKIYQKIDEIMKKHGFNAMPETEDNRPFKEYVKVIKTIKLTMQFYYCKHYKGTDIEIVATQDECDEEIRFLEMHYSDLHSDLETIIYGVMMAIGYERNDEI